MPSPVDHCRSGRPELEGRGEQLGFKRHDSDPILKVQKSGYPDNLTSEESNVIRLLRKRYVATYPSAMIALSPYLRCKATTTQCTLGHRYCKLTGTELGKIRKHVYMPRWIVQKKATLMGLLDTSTAGESDTAFFCRFARARQFK